MKERYSGDADNLFCTAAKTLYPYIDAELTQLPLTAATTRELVMTDTNSIGLHEGSASQLAEKLNDLLANYQIFI